MDEFKKNNKTIIFVSHDLGTVEQFCQTVLWLHQGKLMVSGPVKTVLNEYMTGMNELRKTAANKEHLQAMQSLVNLDQSRVWGTREIEITGFRLLDKVLKEKYFFETGEPVNFMIDFLAHETIPNPIFEFGIYRSDGICCYGTNTDIENAQIGSVDKGKGSLRIKIDNLELLEGKYFFDLGIKMPGGNYYDFHYRIFSMTVHSPIKESGIYHFSHKWILEK